MFGWKKLRFQKKFWSEKFWVQKHFGSKKFGSKKLWVQKILESVKYFESKMFGPTSYGRGLIMVGWISREGLGWGFHSLALE